MKNSSGYIVCQDPELQNSRGSEKCNLTVDFIISNFISKIGIFVFYQYLKNKCTLISEIVFKLDYKQRH